MAYDTAGRAVSLSLRAGGQRRRLAGVFLCLASILLACDSGLTRSRAEEIALGETTPGSQVLSAQQGPLARFADSAAVAAGREDRQVWAVIVSARYPASCPVTETGPRPCPFIDSTMLVIIDRATGEVLYSKVPA